MHDINTLVKILIVEHDPFDIELLQRELKKSDLQSENIVVSKIEDIESAMQSYEPHIILSDYNLPAFSGLEVFKIREKLLPHTPFIFVSGTIGEENATECIKMGVTDYVLKDKMYSLPVKIKRALKEAEEIQNKLIAEKQLIQSQMNLKAIFNNTDTGFLLLDTKLNVVTFNKEMNEITLLLHSRNLKPQEHIIDIIRPERRKELTELMMHVVEGNNINYETHYPRQDGTEEWYNISGKPIKNTDGEVFEISLAVKNITKRKKATQKLDDMVKELTAKNNELHKINLELDRFVYSTSHDLRAPLLSIYGLIDLCNDHLDQPDQLKTLYAMMNTSLNRVDETIKNIIYYSRNTRSEIKAEQLNIEELVNEQVDKLKLIKAHTDINFLFDIDKKTPFYSDRYRVSSIISNMLNNAFKYQRAEETNPLVKLSFQVKNNTAVLTVEDNGEGIAENMQAKVFDMFIRGSQHSTGSGLGLYICREMAEKLNGTINITSQPGKGSLFTVHLPNLISAQNN